MLYQDDFIARLKTGLKSLFPQWKLSESTELALLTVSENATFIAHDPKRKNPVILRVHRPNYHEVAEIQSELAWILALRASRIVDTPPLVPTIDGTYLTSFLDGDDTRHVVAFEFMEGREPDADASLVPGFRLLGEISARLHKHAEDWQTPDAFTRKTWDFESAFGASALWGDWRDALGLKADGKAILTQALEKLKAKLSLYGKGRHRFGLIHADLRLANLLTRDDTIGVIDFDDCGYSWFIYDFAAAISFHELNPIVPELQAAWIDGYTSVRALSEADLAIIPDLIMFRRIILTAWIAHHSETKTAAEAGLDGYTQGTVDLATRYLENTA